MRCLPFGTALLNPNLNFNFNTPYSSSFHIPSHLPFSKSGGCRASQVAELFPSPTISREIIVREARLEDSWEVADTHCSTIFPRFSFHLGLALRINRIVGILSGFSVPYGFRRTCLVAISSFGLNRGCVTGILTIDTVADFLPRKGPLRQRRTGIAYISNVAVKEKYRRKGIAKRLVAKAEAQAKSWGCRAIALHCDVNNPGASKLYKSAGFKCVKIPQGANWPEPRTSPNVKFSFMIKLLKTSNSA